MQIIIMQSFTISPIDALMHYDNGILYKTLFDDME